MGTKDITKGKIKIASYNDTGRIVVDLGTNGRAVDIWYYGEENMSQKEAYANAELICEAFNVANETGLSPIQMRDRIKELEGVLTMVKKEYDALTWKPTTIYVLETALNNKQK